MRNENMTECQHCSHQVPTDQTVETGSGYLICQTCADSEYFTCAECGELFPNDEHYIINSGEWICGDCYNANEVCCENCGSYGYATDMFTDHEHGTVFCDRECYEDYAEEHYFSLDWWSSDSVNWVNRGYGDMYLGIELEVDDGDSPREFVTEARDAFDSFFLYKMDSSLSSYGVEIVSHPATPMYHMHQAPWKGMLQCAKRNGYTSHDNNKCGLHIHINRSYFGRGKVTQTAHILKLMQLFERFDYQFKRFSRRDNFTYCGKNSLRPISDPLFDRVREKIGYGESDRYRAINIEPAETVEIRLWRGTLNEETFFATLEMTFGLAEICRTHSETYLSRVDWYTLCDEIIKSASSQIGRDAHELANYLSRRGLGNVEYDEIEEVA